MILITAKALAAVGASQQWQQPLQSAVNKLSLTTAPELAMFLAQLSHESGGFKRLTECLNYHPAALLENFDKHFKNLADAEAVVAKGECAIAERIYGGRMGNGPEGCGDGYNYRGRGPIQITGKSNYRDAGAWIGVDLLTNPDQVAEPQMGSMVAAWFWHAHNLQILAGNVRAVTTVINGGLIGLDDRAALFTRALAAL